MAADSTNTHKTALGFAEAIALGITSFGGQNFDDSAVLIRYTFMGDSDLSGSVDSSDFTVLARHFNQSSKSWIDGDFNSDGVVNALDFNAVATNFGQTLPVPAGALASLVPEPALASLWICVGLLPRRRVNAAALELSRVGGTGLEPVTPSVSSETDNHAKTQYASDFLAFLRRINSHL